MLELAKNAAIEAGRMALKLRKGTLSLSVKSNQSDITTKADVEAEKIILSAIKKRYPDHSILTEESEGTKSKSEFTWVIDPIDGTIPYFSGLPIFGVSVGLLRNNAPFLGVVNLPVLGKCYSAQKGKGAFVNKKKISVSKTRSLEKGVIGFEFGYAGEREKEILPKLSKLVDKVRYTPVFACTSAALCFVAQGSLDAYFHTVYPWDFVAGVAIVEEAGGKVTDHLGKKIDWTKEWIDLLASNGRIHKEMLPFLQ